MILKVVQTSKGVVFEYYAPDEVLQVLKKAEQAERCRLTCADKYPEDTCTVCNPQDKPLV